MKNLLKLILFLILQELYLIHIRDYIKRITSYTKEGKKDFYSEIIIQDGVMRNLELFKCF